MGRGSDEVLQDLMSLQTRIYRLFDEHAGPDSRREPMSAHWTPPVDIYETDEALVLVAEVPGVDHGDIRLEITDNLLLLSGERCINTGDPGLSYYRIERPNGAFQRAFRLPPGIDSNAVGATYRDGVLRVTLPRGPQSCSRTIAVEVGE